MSTDKAPESSSVTLAILGGGNLGQALARGLVRSGTLRPDQIHVTSLHPPGLEGLAAEGFPVGRDNSAALQTAGTVILAVQPQQIADLPIGTVAVITFETPTGQRSSGSK